MGQTSLLERWTINMTEKKKKKNPKVLQQTLNKECELKRRGENKAGGRKVLL